MNIGKRDGARAGALSRLLRDQCGLEREQIGRIRVRDKHTFIEVEPARAVLGGAQLLAGAGVPVVLAPWLRLLKLGLFGR